ncbi:MAG: hypothetical protein C7N36_14840 [Bacteroidetes bacterium]|nr:MAG: hypothetical protein C7N36_14840 [Bacteroidota bacterium]
MLDINPITTDIKEPIPEQVNFYLEDATDDFIESRGSFRLTTTIDPQKKKDKNIGFDKEAIFEEKQTQKAMASLNQFGSISGERWVKNHAFSAIIADVRAKVVVCEVAIDPESHTFQKRVFEKDLFESFSELTVNYPVLIKIKSKPGALTLEILDGKGIIDESIFEIKEGIEDLLKSDFNQKIEGEINL